MTKTIITSRITIYGKIQLVYRVTDNKTRESYMFSQTFALVEGV